MNSELDIAQFDYELPAELIAQHPAANRSASRLLHLDSTGRLHDRQFTDFPDLLQPGDLLVFNDTRVIKARLTGHKASGGKVEVLIERITDPQNALAHVRSSKAPRPGTTLHLATGVVVTVTGRDQELFMLHFEDPVLEVLERHGTTPLPPYIDHAASPDDELRYQTIYAEHPGAVAAPTAGLHFDAAILERLDRQGIKRAFVTLHVGAGTFQPVRVQRVSDHVMHAERFVVPADTCRLIHATRQSGGRVIAIGTTSARALESAAQLASSQNAPPEYNSEVYKTAAIHSTERTQDGRFTTLAGDTRLFITPGYAFRWVDALLTNFHLPQSTLLMMVSALAGIEPIRCAYQHAVQSRYRFFSYGDAMFIESP